MGQRPTKPLSQKRNTMKLNPNFSELEALVQEMGAKPVRWEVPEKTHQTNKSLRTDTMTEMTPSGFTQNEIQESEALANQDQNQQQGQEQTQQKNPIQEWSGCGDLC